MFLSYGTQGEIVVADACSLNPHKTERHTEMELTVQGFGEEEYVIEVGEKDTTETMRQKVASATGLCEDSFRMGFGGKEEGEDITELSAGDTVVLTKTTKYEAITRLHAFGVEEIAAETLLMARDPEVACLLLQAGVATVIPMGFLYGTSLTALDLSAVSGVKEIRENFLYNCRTLTSVDLSGLSSLTKIDKNFLFNCQSLTTLNWSGLCLTQIGRHFLSNCRGLKEVDLTPLSGVGCISDSFLSHCVSLSTLHLTPFDKATQIGRFFLLGCTSLTAVDFSPLRNVTRVGLYFVENCTSLRRIYLSGCSDVVDNEVRQSNLKEFVVEERPKRTRYASPEESHKRRRHSMNE